MTSDARAIAGKIFDAHVANRITPGHLHDTMTRFQITLVRALLLDVADALAEENVPADTVNRVIHRLVYGALPSPEDVAAREWARTESLSELMRQAPVLTFDAEVLGLPPMKGDGA